MQRDVVSTVAPTREAQIAATRNHPVFSDFPGVGWEGKKPAECLEMNMVGLYGVELIPEMGP